MLRHELSTVREKGVECSLYSSLLNLFGLAFILIKFAFILSVFCIFDQNCFFTGEN